MELFSKYLDQIKAEVDLKERTKAFVKSELERETVYKTEPYAKRTFVNKGFAKGWLRTAVYTLATFSVLTLSGYAYYIHPVNYVSLDINPSVELSINAFNVVIEAEGINKDGESLIKNNSVTHMTVEESIGILVREAENQKFIAKNGSTVIAVTAISNKEDAAILLKEKSENAVKQVIDSMDIDAIVYADFTNLELRARARDLGLSAGKYKMIEILQQVDSSIIFEKYRDMNITDIFKNANKLLLATDDSNGLITEEDFKALAMMKLTASKIQEATMNKQTTYDMNQNSETPVMEQNKIQVQRKNVDDEQSGVINKAWTTIESGVEKEPNMVTAPGVINNPDGNIHGAGGSGGEDSVDKNNLYNLNQQDANKTNSDGKP